MPTWPLPSVTPPTLSQYQFSLNGLTFGAATGIGVLKVTGLDLPVIGSTDMSRPGDQGEFIGLDLYRGRDITIDFWVHPNGTALQTTLLSMRSAFAVGGESEVPFYFQLPNLPLLCSMVRTRKSTYPIDIDYSASQVAKPVVTMHATDPRLYQMPTSTVSISANKTATANNAGNTETRPYAVIKGPAVQPTLTNKSISGNPSISFNVTLSSNDTLIVDFSPPHQIKLNGVINASLLATGATWWNLPPGDNTIEFTSGASVTSGSCTFEYASGYLL